MSAAFLPVAFLSQWSVTLLVQLGAARVSIGNISTQVESSEKTGRAAIIAAAHSFLQMVDERLAENGLFYRYLVRWQALFNEQVAASIPLRLIPLLDDIHIIDLCY